VLFVAEAPGRLGADRSGTPLSGDQTGRNFDLLLRAAQLDRNAIFLTNAVLCNPRNAPPRVYEIRRCAHHLRDTISVVDPTYVVTLGNTALRALQLIEPHQAKLSRDVGQLISWWDRLLIPLYHPGPRARIHRPFSAQVADFQRLGALLASAPMPVVDGEPLDVVGAF
jgi:uracil-DNA glycosylase family 4